MRKARKGVRNVLKNFTRLL